MLYLPPKIKVYPRGRMCINAVKLSWRIQQDFSRRLFRRVDILCTCSFQRESHDQLMDRQLRSTSSTASRFFFISLFCFIYMNSFKTLQTTDFIFFLRKKKFMKSRYYNLKKNRIFEKLIKIRYD